MVKIVIAVVLVFLAGGGWLYLDCLNKQEILSAEHLHQGVDQARIEAKKRADAKTTFENLINAALASCQAAADKSKDDYMVLIEKVAPSKRGRVLIPQDILDTSENIAAVAKAECQQTHAARLKNGQ